MMTRNSALDKFLLSRKFIVCIIVLQFILLPIATKGFRWENIGDLIIYTLSHALIQGMYPYAWTFQIVSLVMLMLLVLRRVTMSRWFMFYVGGCYVLYAIVQKVAVTDKYGFSIVTVNVVMMLLVALLWMREAWRGSSMLTFGNLNRRTAWLIPVALFCLWWPNISNFILPFTFQQCIERYSHQRKVIQSQIKPCIGCKIAHVITADDKPHQRRYPQQS